MCEVLTVDCMTMLEQPIHRYTKSQLRKPEVVRHALNGIVEIQVGGAYEPLFLLPERMLRAQDELSRLATLFVRMTVELNRPEPSSAILGEVGYIAAWTVEERRNFADGFAEALAESFRLNDPNIAQTFVTIMGKAAPTDLDRPDLTGDFSALSDADRNRLTARFSS